MANIILSLAGAYTALGTVFAVAFVTRGIGVVDHAANAASVKFRLLMLPGSALLWPWLLRCWLRARTPAPHSTHSPAEGHA